MKRRAFFTRVESLRAVGTMLIAGYHFSGMAVHGVEMLPHHAWPTAGDLQNTIGRFVLALMPGHAALMMFFVISGFVLRVSLEHGPQDAARVTGRFLIARLFRFYPIVFFGTTFALLVDTNLTQLSFGTIIANFLLFDVSINGTLWALQVELLMAPVIVALYLLERRGGPKLLLALALVTSALHFSGTWALWEPLSVNAFAFVIGMTIPTFGRRMVAAMTHRRVIATACVATVIIFGSHNLLGFYSRPNGLVEAYAAAVLVSLAAYCPDLRLLSFLDWRVLRMLGRAAGSFYVLHLPLMTLFIPAVSIGVPPVWMLHAPAVAGPFLVLVLLAAVAPVALLAHTLIEAPGIELGRRVNTALKLQGRREEPVPAAAVL